MAFHMESFPISAFKVLIWVRSTTTKICNRGCFAQACGGNRKIKQSKQISCVKKSSNPSKIKQTQQQRRTCHVQLLFTWSLSPFQPSTFSLGYAFLRPRFAIEAVSLRLAPEAAKKPSNIKTPRQNIRPENHATQAKSSKSSKTKS